MCDLVSVSNHHLCVEVVSLLEMSSMIHESIDILLLMLNVYDISLVPKYYLRGINCSILVCYILI